MEKLEKLLTACSSKTEESELFCLKNFTEKLKFEANELQSMTGKQSEGAGLRVRKNGKIGFITSTKIEEDIIERAVASAEFGDNSPFPFAKKNIKSSCDYRNKNIDNIHIGNLITKGEDIIKEIRSFDKRINVGITFEKRLEETSLITSSGFNGHYSKNYYYMLIIGELTRDSDMFQVWKGFSDIETIGKEERIISEILFDIKHGMDVVKIENGKYPVLFAPDSVEELLTGFITGVDGNRIYRKTSPLYSKSGQEIFDKRVSIYDDPTITGGYNTCPFDDEGVESQRTPLVEEGILKNFLLDLKNGVKLNRPSSGNSFRKNWISGRNYEFYPSINASCITLNPGRSSYEALLGNIKEGLFVKAVPDLCMGNIQNGDFSGTVCLGFKVKDGKIAGRVKNTVITGNLYDLLKEKLLDMSSEVHTIFSGARLPYMLFRDVEVTS